MTLRAIFPYRERAPLARPDFTSFSPLSREISRLLVEFSRSLGAAGALTAPGLSPSIDVTEADKEIEITADLPGLERQVVEISLEDNVLTIRGEKKMRGDADDKNKNYHMTERSYGRFYPASSCRSGSTLRASWPRCRMASLRLKPRSQRIPTRRRSRSRKPRESSGAAWTWFPSSLRDAPFGGTAAHARRPHGNKSSAMETSHGEGNRHRSRNYQLLRCRDGRQHLENYRKR